MKCQKLQNKTNIISKVKIVSKTYTKSNIDNIFRGPQILKLRFGGPPNYFIYFGDSPIFFRRPPKLQKEIGPPLIL